MHWQNDGESTSDINVSEDLNSSNLTAAPAPLCETSDITILLLADFPVCNLR